MEIKTISGGTINNAICHCYPESRTIIKALVNMRHDSKIVVRFVMRDRAAVEAYLIRQGWQELPVKYYTHREAQT